MNRRLLIGLFLSLFTQAVFAQTMSDEEVLAMGKRLKAAGDDNRTVTAKVLANGATQEQLLRIQSQKNFINASGSQGSIVDGERSNNGEDFVDDEQIDDAPQEGRIIFGRNIFRSKKLSFEPNTSMAIGSNYVVGPGDELIVDIYGASQSSAKYKVSPEGNITIPRIGPIAVSGLTVDAAQSRIYGAMGQHYQNASIKLTVGQTRTISINVMGEVSVPGSYKLSAFATVFHALYMAGGTSDIGTLRDIKVVRNGRIISTVDVYEYILNGRLAGDVKLADNDVIIVGSYNNLVQIVGNVKRPMWYEMKKGETLTTLLNFAGGFAGSAYTKQVNVTRKTGDRFSVNSVDEFDFGNFLLADEDVVEVRGNEHRYENTAHIKGAVKRPGSYGLQKTPTLREILEAAGGLDEEAVTDHGILVRLNEDRTRQTISFDPKGILGGTIPDIALSNEDTITIASLAQLNDSRVLQVQGEVWNPGKYPYSANTTVLDLVTMAGGLRESASNLNVEVARRIVDRNAPTDIEVRSRTFSMALLDDGKEVNGTNFKLEPYDIVYIRRSPVYNIQHSVNISGEVMFAGNYVLENQNIRLSEIVKRAGGLKRNSSAHNARLVRKMTEEEMARERELLALASRSSDSIDIQAYVAKDKYTVGIDMEKALANPGGPDDIVLRDNDEIYVPLVNTTVQVNGEVLFPNSVTYEPKKGWKYYVEESGGFTKESARRRAYIVYSNGHIAKASKGKIEPGCEIIVPKKPKKQDSSASLARWISISSAISTTAAVIVTLFKK